MIQVKTDMNNDGQYSDMTQDQFDYVKLKAKQIGCVPVLVHYNPYINIYSAQYINT